MNEESAIFIGDSDEESGGLPSNRPDAPIKTPSVRVAATLLMESTATALTNRSAMSSTASPEHVTPRSRSTRKSAKKARTSSRISPAIRVTTTARMTAPRKSQERPTLLTAATNQSTDAPSYHIPRSLELITTRFLPAKWPSNIVNLRTVFNPDDIVLPYSPRFGSCQCSEPCRRGQCRNSTLGLFCAPNCCPFGGRCGNGLHQSEDLMLAADSTTHQLAVVATSHIDQGVVLGEYLGRLTLEKPRQDRERQRGYRLVMRAAPKHCGQWKACIDAEAFGNITRFVNHSCEPRCGFFEVGNGHAHTVVLAATQDIEAGQEVTVDYGAELWFICRCGQASCTHRHIQQQQDL